MAQEFRMAVIGYARVSTTDQDAGYQAQLRDLNAYGCEDVYQERVSAVGDRPQLKAALRFVRKGDVLVVTKLDRLVRSTVHLMNILDELKEKGVELKVLDSSGIDTSTPNGRAFISILGVIAELERNIMLERQREGIAAAKAAGKYKGKPPLADSIKSQIRADIGAGMTKKATAKKHNLSERVIYKVMAEQTEGAN
jgi:DNA invertase Pin-like site-specific DNA recombinase